MDTFAKLFGSLVAFVYHCFDRIVILGHLPLLTRPENIVHFFRDVHQVGAITKEVLRQRADDYTRWVASFARNHRVPIEWAQKGVRKEDYVLPSLRQMERSKRFRKAQSQVAVGEVDESHAARSKTTASSIASAVSS